MLRTATAAKTPGVQRGMVLLEILVALVILAVTGSAVIRLAAQQVSMLGQLRSTLYAGWVADNQLVQLRLATGAGPHVRQWVQGDSLMGGSSWRWRYRYQDSDVLGTDALEIQVFRPGEQASLVSVTTLVAKR